MTQLLNKNVEIKIGGHNGKVRVNLYLNDEGHLEICGIPFPVNYEVWGNELVIMKCIIDSCSYCDNEDN